MKPRLFLTLRGNQWPYGDFFTDCLPSVHSHCYCHPLPSWRRTLQGRGRLAMAKVDRATPAGLTMESTRDGEGNWNVVLTDDHGSVVFEAGGYTDEARARAVATRWIGEHYEAQIKQTRLRPEPKPKPSSSSNQLVLTIRRKAITNVNEAARLREQADLLEEEAKRLTAAADVLEGPEEA